AGMREPAADCTWVGAVQDAVPSCRAPIREQPRGLRDARVRCCGHSARRPARDARCGAVSRLRLGARAPYRPASATAQRGPRPRAPARTTGGKHLALKRSQGAMSTHLRMRRASGEPQVGAQAPEVALTGVSVASHSEPRVLAFVQHAVFEADTAAAPEVMSAI